MLFCPTAFHGSEVTAMSDGSSDPSGSRDLTALFDTVEFPDAFRITYLGNAIINPVYDAIKRDFGLIRPEYTVLACLSHYPELTAQDVATISRQPRNTISRAVHRTLAEGYIERAPDPEDGRQARLRITPAGRALHKKAAAYMAARQEEVLAGLDAGERRTLGALLRKAAQYAAALRE
ncbi:MarR family winged helix-turn-helix transcriptional regulator [Paralimibaculum aggregatum]|nr:MarR family transcriptional regulator [Limibaculum sp. NKW23]